MFLFDSCKINMPVAVLCKPCAGTSNVPSNADQRRVVLSLQPLPSGSRAGEEQAQPSADTDGGPRTLSAALQAYKGNIDRSDRSK